MSATIYTVVNEDYFEFAKIFLLSLIDNTPDRKIKKIVINDTGLLDNQRKVLKSISKKIEIFKTTNETIPTDFKIHTENWRKVVGQKTIGLHKICKKENYPIIMLDCDMYIVSDFTNEIKKSDIQVCKRPRLINNNGYVLDYIACWFIVNNEKGKHFLESWMESIPHIKGAHRETPALCKTIYNFKHQDDYVIVEDDSKSVASLNFNTDPKIVHFKSQGYNQTFSQRIKNVKNTPKFIDNKITEYLKYI